MAVAGTGQDDHDGPPGGFASSAAELHQGRLGPVRRAAAAVGAGAAVARLVGLDAGAVLVGEVDGRLAAHHPLAPAAYLQGRSAHVRVVLERNQNKNVLCATISLGGKSIYILYLSKGMDIYSGKNTLAKVRGLIQLL